jgi:uncharacterized protein (TIGR00290 family)
MANRRPVIISWSGGKDCTLALQAVHDAGDYEVVALLTTVNRDHDRITMHGVRRELLEQQVASLSYQLRIVEVSAGCSNEEYQERMSSVLLEYRACGVGGVVHGDIFLEDVRRYREAMLGTIEMEGIFPIWKEDTRTLADRFQRLGYRALLTCVDTAAVTADLAGAPYDANLLDSLPASVDPCGENGEFHTFVFDGPIFRTPIVHSLGEIVFRDQRFAFRDLLPGEPADGLQALPG